MKTFKLLLFLLLISCLSCSSKENRTQVNSVDSIASPKSSNSYVTPSHEKYSPNVDTATIINDSFISTALQSDLTLSAVASAYSSVTPTQQVNAVDTLVAFVSGSDTISIRKGGGNRFLEYMNVTSTTLTLASTIHVGVTKSVLESKFGNAPLPDIFRVENLEGGCRFIFVCSSGTLQKILYVVTYKE